MKPPLFFLVAATAAVLSGTAASADDKVVRLCADHWMPYNGDPGDSRPGYVVELARTIFEPQGVKVEYAIVPWEEALAEVRAGRRHGAIGAGESETEGLTRPSEAVGEAAVCLMTTAGSTWTYDNLSSFRSARLGVIKDYEYWPALDAYIERKAGDGVTVVEGEEPLGELMNLLVAGKLEVVAEIEPVLLWYLREHELDRARFRVVYKHRAEPIYVAFAPTEDGRRFAAMFDEGMRAARSSGELDRLLRRYGISDWKPRGS